MAIIRKSKDKYGECNFCGNNKELIEITGRGFLIVTICSDCVDGLEKFKVSNANEPMENKTEACINPLVMESVCLHENVIRNGDLIDCLDCGAKNF